MKFKIARMSILGIEWYFPYNESLRTCWTFEGHLFDHRISDKRIATKLAKELIQKGHRTELSNVIFVAEWKDDRWKFTEVKA